MTCSCRIPFSAGLPYRCPIGFPVLKDIEWKAEMKHIDMAVSRTMNNCVLHIKMGFEGKDGALHLNSDGISKMQSVR